jgi:hypothetical protein
MRGQIPEKIKIHVSSDGRFYWYPSINCVDLDISLPSSINRVMHHYQRQMWVTPKMRNEFWNGGRITNCLNTN